MATGPMEEAGKAKNTALRHSFKSQWLVCMSATLLYLLTTPWTMSQKQGWWYWWSPKSDLVRNLISYQRNWSNLFSPPLCALGHSHTSTGCWCFSSVICSLLCVILEEQTDWGPDVFCRESEASVFFTLCPRSRVWSKMCKSYKEKSAH